MNCLGTFRAQYYKLLSFDPNTIFQLFVFGDRVFMIKIGTAFNQLLEVWSHGLVDGPVGLDEPAAKGLPTVEEARRLVAETRKTKALSLESAVKSREINFSELESTELRRTGLFGRGLHFKLRSGEKLQFRLLEEVSEDWVAHLMKQALGSRHHG